MTAKLYGIVIDTPDPAGLATFYQQLLGMQRLDESDDWVTIGESPGKLGLAFQLAPDLQAAQWPDPDRPQQMHLDIEVDDLVKAERQALDLGASRLPGGNDHCWVFSDPSGHPFCLFTG
jgi:catechol-2,3-dioxygenase